MTFSSSDDDVDDRDGGVGDPATRGKLMLPGIRWSSGTVGDGKTRGIHMMLFFRRLRRPCDRFNAVGGLRTGGCGGGGACDAWTGGASSTLGVDDWIGEAPAVGDVVARGMDGARRRRR